MTGPVIKLIMTITITFASPGLNGRIGLKPRALISLQMLKWRHATVTTCHSKTRVVIQ